ncbi:hypothetical protein [Formosa haliotis]|uniref:hypothetical protein n=1 Tax=Formosa haliotis TaxID=1555194 RepID=UPI000824AABE|nr:hypothetical protein [Formosa haliotis]
MVENLFDLSGSDSLFVDVSGRSRSPYLKKTALVLSPLKENSNSTSVTFVTGSDFTMQSSSTTITSLQADFGNGQGYQTIPLSGTKSIKHYTAGIYNFKFKESLSHGTTKYTYGKIGINSTEV